MFAGGTSCVFTLLFFMLQTLLLIVFCIFHKESQRGLYISRSDPLRCKSAALQWAAALIYMSWRCGILNSVSDKNPLHIRMVLGLGLSGLMTENWAAIWKGKMQRGWGTPAHCKMMPLNATIYTQHNNIPESHHPGAINMTMLLSKQSA